ncbi:hypothetical protein VTI74DRAFT_4517 [Chaetomium olivicolor]
MGTSTLALFHAAPVGDHMTFPFFCLAWRAVWYTSTHGEEISSRECVIRRPGPEQRRSQFRICPSAAPGRGSAGVGRLKRKATARPQITEPASHHCTGGGFGCPPNGIPPAYQEKNDADFVATDGPATMLIIKARGDTFLRPEVCQTGIRQDFRRQRGPAPFRLCLARGQAGRRRFFLGDSTRKSPPRVRTPSRALRMGAREWASWRPSLGDGFSPPAHPWRLYPTNPPTWEADAVPNLDLCLWASTASLPSHRTAEPHRGQPQGRTYCQQEQGNLRMQEHGENPPERLGGRELPFG